MWRQDYLLLWSVVHVDVLLLEITDASRPAEEVLQSSAPLVAQKLSGAAWRRRLT